MEIPTDDAKMLVLMKLDPREAVTVCESSEKMNRICRKTQYNIMWQNKIKTDFGVDETEEGYEKYRFLERLYRTKVYIVTIAHYEDDGESLYLFDTRDKAEKFIFVSLGGTYPYSSMKRELDRGILENGAEQYFIREMNFYNKDISEFDKAFYEQKRDYETNKKKERKPRGFLTPYMLSEPMRKFLLEADFGMGPDGFTPIKDIIRGPVSEGYFNLATLTSLMTIYFYRKGLVRKENNKTLYRFDDEAKRYFGEWIDGLQKEDIAAGIRRDNRGGIIEPFNPDGFSYNQIPRILRDALLYDSPNLDEAEKARLNAIADSIKIVRHQILQ